MIFNSSSFEQAYSHVVIILFPILCKLRNCGIVFSTFAEYQETFAHIYEKATIIAKCSSKYNVLTQGY